MLLALVSCNSIFIDILLALTLIDIMIRVSTAVIVVIRVHYQIVVYLGLDRLFGLL